MPRIYKTKYTISDMQNIANTRNGKCLSTEFKRVDENLTWQCEQGHIWDALAQNILKGNWCRKCAIEASKGKAKKNPTPAKYSLDDLHEIAELNGGKCHASEYISIVEPVQWECKEGHVFFNSFNKIKNKKQWCKQCKMNDVKNLTMKSIFSVVETKGGVIKSVEGIGGKSKLIIECNEGHQWETTGSRVLIGNWCPICCKPRRGKETYSSKYTIKDAHDIAAAFGGSCLSQTISSSRDELTWECKNGHKWNARFSKVYTEKHWCFECNTLNLTVGKLRDYALSHGGKLLSQDRIDDETPLRTSDRVRLQCANGHEWVARGSILVRGGWCKLCAFYKKRKYTIGMVRDIARQRLGTCISLKEQSDTFSITTYAKGEFVCADGHTFTTRFDSILKGHWCLECANNEKRLGKNQKTVIHGLALNITKNKTISTKRTREIENILHAISAAKLPPLETPIFSTSKNADHLFEEFSEGIESLSSKRDKSKR